MTRMKARVAAMIERFDADGDGFISPDEMPQPKRSGRMFDMIDADDSGAISRAEFDEAREWHDMRRDRGHGKMKRRGQSD